MSKKEKYNATEGAKPVKKFHPIRAFFKLILALILIGMIAVMAGGIALGVMIYPSFVSISSEMKDIASTMDANSFKRSGNTEILDATGTVIGKYGGEKYVYVNYDDISSYMTDGYVAEEDERFYEHFGLDLKAIARAAYSLIKNKGHITQGGSTITQQVVKINLLTSERSYRRKLLEIFLAIELEKLYTKQEILEIYCNSCYYGNLCYGIEAASQYYFGHSSSELTLAEAAILVGTSNSPNNYNPVADYEKATTKKKGVLKHMLEQGYIDQSAYDEAMNENPEVIGVSSNSIPENYQNSYALDCAIKIFMEQDGFEFRYLWSSQEDYDKYQESYNEEYQKMSEEIRSGGYTIYTTLDPKIQSTLQESVDNNLREFTSTAEDGRFQMQGAAVCIDNTTQMVVAIVGGRGKTDNYNRGFLARRQPGSSIKPLLDYGPAFDSGIVTPASIINDEVIEVGGYAPKNAGGGYHGKVTVREALNRSLNTVAFKLLLCNGIRKSTEYLAKLHFSTLEYEDMGSSSLAIGGFTTGVRVTDMARGYATLANEGRYTSNTCISSIEHFTEGLVYQASRETSQVYSEDTAYMLADVLQGTFRETYGTASKLLNSSEIFAGKTGTTNDNKDAWFCGFSKYYTTAVWVGCDMPKEVKGLTGASYPGYIWSEFMGKMHEDLDAAEFNMPETLMLEETSTGTQQSVWFEGGSYESRKKGWDYVSGSIDYEETLIKDPDKYIRENYIDKEEKSDEDETDSKKKSKKKKSSG